MTKIKNSYIGINNIAIIIQKRIGGKYATLLADFGIFNSADYITFKQL